MKPETSPLEALKFWLDPPPSVANESGYFRDKVKPLIPGIVDKLVDDNIVINELTMQLAAKEVEITNLRARLAMHASELQTLRAKLDEQAPEIYRLNQCISAAVKLLQNK